MALHVGDLGTLAVMVIILLSFLLGPINALLAATPRLRIRSPTRLKYTDGSESVASNDPPSTAESPLLEWSKHWCPVAEVRDAVELQSPR